MLGKMKLDTFKEEMFDFMFIHASCLTSTRNCNSLCVGQIKQASPCSTPSKAPGHAYDDGPLSRYSQSATLPTRTDNPYHGRNKMCIY